MRLEGFMSTPGLGGDEVNAVTAEISLVTIAATCGVVLRRLKDQLRQVTMATSAMTEEDVASLPRTETLTHFMALSQVVIETGYTALRLECLLQWPQLLDETVALQAGMALVAPLENIKTLLARMLKRIITEGDGLSPDPSEVTQLQQAMEGLIVVGGERWEGWNPPSLNLYRVLDRLHFTLWGALVLSRLNSVPLSARRADIEGKVWGEVAKIMEKMTNGKCLPHDGGVMEDLEPLLKECDEKAMSLYTQITSILATPALTSEESDNDNDILGPKIELTHKALSALSTRLRRLEISYQDDDGVKRLLPLTLETNDMWHAIITFVGDWNETKMDDANGIDLNCWKREKSIVAKVQQAQEDQEKLKVSLAKVATLERSVISKSREISFQNKRLMQLETLLSQSENEREPSSGKSTPAASLHAASAAANEQKEKMLKDEITSLKEENRVLTEAMDVTSAKADNLEKEIRALKDNRPPNSISSRRKTTVSSSASVASVATATPSRRTFTGTPNRSSNLGDDFVRALLSPEKPAPSNVNNMSLGKMVGLEAAFFRPALQAAKQEGMYWKHKVIENSMHGLPPLTIPSLVSGQPQDGGDSSGGTSDHDRAKECRDRLLSAKMNLMLTKASIKIIDLSKGEGRAMLRKNNESVKESQMRLDHACERARRCLMERDSRMEIY